MNLKPRTAWQPFEPTRNRPWNRRLAAHLFRRAAFGASDEQLDEAVESSPEESVDRLLADCNDTTTFDTEMQTVAETVVAAGDVGGLETWWLYRMLHTPAPLLEQMTLFWHGHFATSGAKVRVARSMLNQNELFRRHAFGHFEPMVQAVSRDPAMLVYLDSTTNSKVHPNENYARELMELFCLGLGKYAEKDVQELGRCFTGWEVRRDRFRFNPFQHDDGEKTFLGQTGPFDGDDATRVILSQPAASRFIARKLVQYFVCDEPLPDTMIEPLAVELRKTDFQIEPTLRRILTSQIFNSKQSVGQKIRGPVELAIGLLRALDGTTSAWALTEWLRPLGQRLFFPPSVKGWDGGRTWLNATTVLGRANLVRNLIDDETSRFAGGSLLEMVVSRGVESPGDLVHWLAEMLVAVPLPRTVQAELVTLAKTTHRDENQRIGNVVHALAAIPEFQLA